MKEMSLQDIVPEVISDVIGEYSDLDSLYLASQYNYDWRRSLLEETKRRLSTEEPYLVAQRHDDREMMKWILQNSPLSNSQLIRLAYQFDLPLILELLPTGDNMFRRENGKFRLAEWLFRSPIILDKYILWDRDNAITSPFGIYIPIILSKYGYGPTIRFIRDIEEIFPENEHLFSELFLLVLERLPDVRQEDLYAVVNQAEKIFRGLKNTKQGSLDLLGEHLESRRNYTRYIVENILLLKPTVRNVCLFFSNIGYHGKCDGWARLLKREDFRSFLEDTYRELYL